MEGPNQEQFQIYLNKTTHHRIIISSRVDHLNVYIYIYSFSLINTITVTTNYSGYYYYSNTVTEYKLKSKEQSYILLQNSNVIP